MNKRHKLLILVLMGIFLAIMYSYSEAASKTYGTIVVSKVVSVYDGDTFKVNIDGWPDIIGKNISIRIYGIDTPEIRGTKGEAKQLALKAKALSAKRLLEAGTVTLRNIKRGKYFRIIAEVYVDRVHLGTLLIRNGLAKEYYGGKRPIW